MLTCRFEGVIQLNIMAAFFILPLILFFNANSITHIQNNSISNTSLSSQINSTLSYINQVNQSSYLIFYPNLSSAYNEINMARNSSNSITINHLLESAKSSAEQQNNMLNNYRYISFIVMLILVIFSSILLYKLTLPFNSKKINRKKI